LPTGIQPCTARWNRQPVKYNHHSHLRTLHRRVCGLFLLLAGIGAAAEREPGTATDSPPLVWVFTGLPGDVEHLVRFSETADLLSRTLQERFGVPKGDIRMLFGEGDWGGHRPCNRTNLEAELERIVTATRDPGSHPVWLFFLGHANSNEHDAFFNSGGPDLSARDLGKCLRKAGAGAPVVIWLTTAAAGTFVKHLAKPGRIVVAACADDAEDNETEFPHVLAQTLAAASTDADGDGRVSVLEIFASVKAGVRASYEADGLIQTERPLLDGDGDGQATATPAETDAAPARTCRLLIRP